MVGTLERPGSEIESNDNLRYICEEISDIYAHCMPYLSGEEYARQNEEAQVLARDIEHSGLNDERRERMTQLGDSLFILMEQALQEDSTLQAAKKFTDMKEELASASRSLKG